MNKLKSLLLLAVLMPAMLFAQGWKSKTLIKMGDKTITAQEFMDVYEKNNVKSDVIDKKDVDEYLDMFVNFKLKVTEAEALKMDTLPKFVKEFEGYRKQLAKPYLSNDEETENLVEEAYDRMHWDINASHILVRCDINAVPADTLKAYKKALALRERVLKGEDFGDLAYDKSEDPSAHDTVVNGRFYKGNRGNLGYFTVFDMVYPFETGAYNTPIGELSMPVRSDFGYHIIKVNSKTTACGMVTAAHIFLVVDDKDPLKTDSVVREKAFNIYNEIAKDGKNWDAIARRYSEDKGTATNGGVLTPFKVSQIVPEFIDVVKQLNPGEFSEPVKTSYGYHIIKLVNTKGIRNFDDEKENIKKRVEKDMRAKASDEIVMKRIMKENKFKEYVKVKDEFIATVDSSLNQGQYVMAEGVKTNKVLFKFNKQKYTVGDFAAFLKTKTNSQPFMSPAAYAYKLYDEYLKTETFAYEDAHLEEKYPEFKMLVTEYHDGILLFDLMDKEVWKKAEKDTLGLQNYYEEHMNEYMWGERIKTIFVVVPTPDKVKIVESLLKNDLSIDSIRSIIKKADLRGVSAKSQYFQHGDNVDIDEIEWIPGKIYTIPSTVDKMTRIVKILEIRQPEPKSFREAKGLVTSAYQTKLEEDWVESLEEKYNPQIDAKILEKVKSCY
ncbi:MAG: peptidylprolyl isomerase [Bacteroidales bacterium]|nr:peptidylprolyl isomerase [Bacteroidales bacterium]